MWQTTGRLRVLSKRFVQNKMAVHLYSITERLNCQLKDRRFEIRHAPLSFRIDMLVTKKKCSLIKTVKQSIVRKPVHLRIFQGCVKGTSVAYARFKFLNHIKYTIREICKTKATFSRLQENSIGNILDWWIDLLVYVSY